MNESIYDEDFWRGMWYKYYRYIPCPENITYKKWYLKLRNNSGYISIFDNFISTLKYPITNVHYGDTINSYYLIDVYNKLYRIEYNNKENNIFEFKYNVMLNCVSKIIPGIIRDERYFLLNNKTQIIDESNMSERYTFPFKIKDMDGLYFLTKNKILFKCKHVYDDELIKNIMFIKNNTNHLKFLKETKIPEYKDLLIKKKNDYIFNLNDFELLDKGIIKFDHLIDLIFYKMRSFCILYQNGILKYFYEGHINSTYINWYIEYKNIKDFVLSPLCLCYLKTKDDNKVYIYNKFIGCVSFDIKYDNKKYSSFLSTEKIQKLHYSIRVFCVTIKSHEHEHQMKYYIDIFISNDKCRDYTSIYNEHCKIFINYKIYSKEQDNIINYSDSVLKVLSISSIPKNTFREIIQSEIN